MKFFLKKISLFCACLFGLLAAGIILSSAVLREKAIIYDTSDTSHIILGHSHPEFAFNDSLIPSFKNYSEGGESFLYTFQKAKFIAEFRPDVKTVFIDFSNNSFDNEKRIDDELTMQKFFAIYNPFMNMEDNMLLMRANLSAYISTIAKTSLKNFLAIFTQDFNYADKIGEFVPRYDNNIDSLHVSTFVIHRKVDNQIDKYISNPTPDMIYLRRVLNLYKKNNTDVFLIRSPVHPKWPGYENELTYQTVRNEFFGDIEYLDFSEFPLYDSEFADLQHLNHKGADKFSEWFSQIMDASLLKKGNKQEFIDTEISKLKEEQSMQ